MNKKAKLGLGIVFACIITGLFVILLHGKKFALFSPEGTIAAQEKSLILFTVVLGFAVVIPVLVLAFSVAWRYRETNTKAVYAPDWDHNRRAEAIWWLLPCLIIFILSVVTWQSTHALDPYKALASKVKPIPIEVVALDWKWLFIYPDQHIATVNFVQFPKNTPVDFMITADAPMNSFWIPQLSGQIYAMSGMTTQLHLMASQTGSFDGLSANLSGDGFAGMKFIAKSSTNQAFNQWVNQTKQSPNNLTMTSYTSLAKPSSYNRAAYYTLGDDNLYNEIEMKFLMPTTVSSKASTSSTDDAMSGSMDMSGMGM